MKSFLIISLCIVGLYIASIYDKNVLTQICFFIILSIMLYYKVNKNIKNTIKETERKNSIEKNIIEGKKYHE